MRSLLIQAMSIQNKWKKKFSDVLILGMVIGFCVLWVLINTSTPKNLNPECCMSNVHTNNSNHYETICCCFIFVFFICLAICTFAANLWLIYEVFHHHHHQYLIKIIILQWTIKNHVNSKDTFDIDLLKSTNFLRYLMMNIINFFINF